MIFRASIIGILISAAAVAWETDLGWGFIVIMLGLAFITILEYWNNKNKPKPPKPSNNGHPLGIGA